MYVNRYIAKGTSESRKFEAFVSSVDGYTMVGPAMARLVVTSISCLM